MGRRNKDATITAARESIYQKGLNLFIPLLVAAGALAAARPFVTRFVSPPPPSPAAAKKPRSSNKPSKPRGPKERFTAFKAAFVAGPSSSRLDALADSTSCSGVSPNKIDGLGLAQMSYLPWCVPGGKQRHLIQQSLFLGESASSHSALPSWLLHDLNKRRALYLQRGEVASTVEDVLEVVRPSCEPFVRALIECIAAATKEASLLVRNSAWY